MENLKLDIIKKLGVVLIALFAMNLIGCSDSGGGSKASTKACPANPYYDSYEDEWYVSRYDLTSCNPLPRVVDGNCGPGEAIVRSPYDYGVNFEIEFEVGVSAGSNIRPNYHQSRGNYSDVCLNQGGRAWDYVDYNPRGDYHYVNYNRIYGAQIGASVSGSISAGVGTHYGPQYGTPPIIYQSGHYNQGINPLWSTVLTLGVLAILL